MRKTSLILASALLAVVAAPAAQAKPRLTGEERLAKMLEGRVAGEPVSCINLRQATSSRIIDRTAIVYEVGRTLYVNRPTNANSLDDDDILVTRLHGSELCRVDIVHLRDRSHRGFAGTVSLGDFVPYRKAMAARN